MAGQLIRWALFDSWLGSGLVAADEDGLCRLSFDEGQSDLQRRFPMAGLCRVDPETDVLLNAALRVVENPALRFDHPLSSGGTAFERAVWRAVRAVPAGQTKAYARIAAEIGRPSSARAVGAANGRNPIAIIIPCHRLVRGSGALAGYAYGLDRKQALLAREAIVPDVKTNG